MTAEERMAYFQGEMKRSSVQQIRKNEKNISTAFLKLKFFIALILFVVFLSMDYTGYKIQGMGSREIVQLVITDLDLSGYMEKYTL